ncbi:hypothetical protein SDC9_168851 [bioreactor metagenome]|uniref:Uncharacterized protein n=1 Tax=bioreactor metagenome TaxID=1076179 RepID=A0A645G3M4_9ZZZZ
MKAKRLVRARQRQHHGRLQPGHFHAHGGDAAVRGQPIERRLHQLRKTAAAQHAARQTDHAAAQRIAFGRGIDRHQPFADQHAQDVQTGAGNQLQRIGNRLHAHGLLGVPQQSQDGDGAADRRHGPHSRAARSLGCGRFCRDFRRFRRALRSHERQWCVGCRRWFRRLRFRRWCSPSPS